MHRKHRRFVSVTCAAAIFPLVVAACGREDGSASGEGEPLIGFSNRFIAGNAWLSTLTDGAVKAGDERGYKVETADAQGDATTQIAQMKTFINKGAEAIIIEPVGDRNVAGGIEAAKQAGVPVIVVNDRVSEELAGQVACNIYDDGFETAKMVGAATAEAAASRLPKNEPIDLYIQALFPQELVTQQREEGFMEGWNGYFEENPGFTTNRIPNNYGEALPDRTLEAMRNVVSANPEIDVVFNQTDVVMDSVTQALQGADLMQSNGTSDVIIAGFDGGMEVIKDMANNPDSAIVATGLNQPAKQAGYAVEEAIAAIEGEETGECEGSTPTRILPPEIVTPQNAGKYVDDDLAFAGSL